MIPSFGLGLCMTSPNNHPRFAFPRFPRLYIKQYPTRYELLSDGLSTNRAFTIVSMLCLIFYNTILTEEMPAVRNLQVCRLNHLKTYGTIPSLF
jgi:hypothetical protein